jgi:hypothetical protein
MSAGCSHAVEEYRGAAKDFTFQHGQYPACLETMSRLTVNSNTDHFSAVSSDTDIVTDSATWATHIVLLAF